MKARILGSLLLSALALGLLTPLSGCARRAAVTTMVAPMPYYTKEAKTKMEPVETTAPLPPGTIAATVALNAATTPPAPLHVNMKVDVECLRKDGKGNKTAETVLRDVQIVGLKKPDKATEPGEKAIYTVTLAVTEPEAEKLALAEASGQIQLVHGKN